MINRLKYLIVIIFFIFLIGCNTEHIHEFNNHKCDCGVYEDLTVTFIYNDNVHKIIVKYNDLILIDDIELEGVEKEGYKFIGWFEGDNKFDFSKPISDNIILFAKYEKIEDKEDIEDKENIDKLFNVKIIGFNNELIKTYQVKEGSKIEPLESIEVEGYEFIGWFESDSLFDFNALITKDTIIKAIYQKKNIYKVTFVDSDNEILLEYELYENDEVIYPENPVKEYFNFIGWDKDIIKISDNVVIKAIYEPVIQDYTIEYVIDDSMWEYSSKEEMLLDFLNDFYDFVDPIESKYTFIGEKNDFDGYWQRYIGGSISSNNKLIYSNDIDADNDDYFFNSTKYKPKWYKLSQYMKNEICKSNKRFGYPDIEYKHGALDFKRYLLNDPSTYIETYGGEEVFYGLPNFKCELVKTFTYNDEVVLRDPKNSYFDGWYLDEDFSDGPYEKIERGSFGNKKFYAKIIEIREFVISFDTNGGSYVEDLIVENGDLIKLPISNKLGSDFIGWYLDNDLYKEEFKFDHNCDIVLKAKWYSHNEVNFNKLVYDGKTVTYRDSIISVDIPDKYIQKDEELRAIWVSSFINSYKPSEDKNIMQNELNYVLELLEYYNFNCVFFHLRTHNNAFYKTELAPIKEGYGNFDSWDYLPWFIEECHKRGIEFHAWLNPYRIYLSGLSLDVTKEDVSNEYVNYPKNPSSNPDNILLTYATGNKSRGAILDPSKEVVQNYIVNVCKEIIDNYDVDGIHFDDYFYAKQGLTSDILLDADQKEYEHYIETNATSFKIDSIEDKQEWRRNNVSNLIYKLKETFDSYYIRENRKIEFGISPTGVYKSGDGSVESGSNTTGGGHYGNYLYADTYKWAKNGWIDYIMPHLYNSFTHPNSDLVEKAIWWNKAMEGLRCKLYFGVGISRAVATDEQYSWHSEEDELINQLLYHSSMNNVKGVTLFSFTSLKTIHNDKTNIAHNALQRLRDEIWNNEINVPR